MDAPLTEAEWIELTRLVERADSELLTRLLREAGETLGRIPTPVDDDGGLLFNLITGRLTDADARVHRALATRIMSAQAAYRYLLDKLREYATNPNILR